MTPTTGIFPTAQKCESNNIHFNSAHQGYDADQRNGNNEFPIPQKLVKRQETCVPHLRNCRAVSQAEAEKVAGVIAKFDAKKHSKSSGSHPITIDVTTSDNSASVERSCRSKECAVSHTRPGVCTHCGRSDDAGGAKRRIKEVSMTRFLDRDFSKLEKERFQTLLTEMFVDNNISFRAVESRSFKRLMRFTRPVSVRNLPSASTLGGRLLEKLE